MRWHLALGIVPDRAGAAPFPGERPSGRTVVSGRGALLTLI